MKHTVAVLMLVLVSMFFTAGCQTAPADVPEDLRPDMKNPQRVGSGRSSAETNTNDMPLNTGVAWGASKVDQTSTTAKYQPTASTSGTGSLVTGFQLGAVSEVNQKARDFVATTIKGDPVLKNLGDELKYLMDEVEYGPEWQARADILRAALAARSSQLYEDLTTAGLSTDVNLAALTHIVVVGFITSNVGHDERAPTDQEIEAVARVLPNIVSASRGEETEKKPDGN